MTSLLRRSLAELVGTFGFVFIGCAVVVMKSAPGAGYGLLGIAWGHAIALSIMVTATMAISGGHLNPAVTVGLFVGRRINGATAVGYIVAQLVGAVVAAFAVKHLFPVVSVRATSLGTPALAGNVQLSQAIGIEAILTFFLVSMVFGTCVNSEAPKVGGFAIGLVLLCDVLIGGPLTGAAANPARAFGPALVSGQWVAHSVYWIGPLLGGIVAGLIWEYVLLPRRER
jgi:MIP family channel proteins